MPYKHLVVIVWVLATCVASVTVAGCQDQEARKARFARFENNIREFKYIGDFFNLGKKMTENEVEETMGPADKTVSTPGEDNFSSSPALAAGEKDLFWELAPDSYSGVRIADGKVSALVYVNGLNWDPST